MMPTQHFTPRALPRSHLLVPNDVPFRCIFLPHACATAHAWAFCYYFIYLKFKYVLLFVHILFITSPLSAVSEREASCLPGYNVGSPKGG
jgi:hypothetical protein